MWWLRCHPLNPSHISCIVYSSKLRIIDWIYYFQCILNTTKKFHFTKQNKNDVCSKNQNNMCENNNLRVYTHELWVHGWIENVRRVSHKNFYMISFRLFIETKKVFYWIEFFFLLLAGKEVNIRIFVSIITLTKWWNLITAQCFCIFEDTKKYIYDSLYNDIKYKRHYLVRFLF